MTQRNHIAVLILDKRGSPPLFQKEALQMSDQTGYREKPGYYAVNILVVDHRIPYIVFARSEFEAARKIRAETGYVAERDEVEGPIENYV